MNGLRFLHKRTDRVSGARCRLEARGLDAGGWDRNGLGLDAFQLLPGTRHLCLEPAVTVSVLEIA